jgi:uncharacterized repeat protein (TIGR03803 family)
MERKALISSYIGSTEALVLPSLWEGWFSTGNLYGTASNAPTGSGCSADCGIVFELSPPATPTNQWQETTLFTFVYPSQEGSNPFAALIRDKSGNLYGTTSAGGAHGGGAVFKLKPQLSGGFWTEVILHSFDNLPDGYLPYGKLILVNGKGFYGTTSRGGSHDAGMVFNLSIVPRAVANRWTRLGFFSVRFF